MSDLFVKPHCWFSHEAAQLWHSFIHYTAPHKMHLFAADELPFVTVTLDQGNDGHGLLNPSTTEQVVITKKLPPNANGN